MCVSVKEANELVAAQGRMRGAKVQIGFQRRANPRFIEGVKLIREDRVLGDIVDGRVSFNNSWGGAKGLGGKGSWQSRVAKSGDWMIEQAVHSWDVMNWVAGATPARTINPPIRAKRPGVSPRKRNTQTGFKTGSSVLMSVASIAGTCLMADVKKINDNPIWKMPRYATISQLVTV